jgi:hypothetical protein
MKNLPPVLLILLAIIAGEITLVLLSSLVQGVLYDGIFWTSSPKSDIFIGGFLTFLSAVIPGYLAMWIVRNKTYFPHIVISLLIAVETTWLITRNQTPDPVWFDALAGLSLIVGIFLGGWLKRKLQASGSWQLAK